MKNKEISVVIPAYNEEPRIKNTIEKTISYLKKNKYNYEIIVIDNASSDKTTVIVKKLIAHNKKIKLLVNASNRGKGYSVKRGMLHSKYKLILHTDADASTPIDELDKFMQYIDDFDVIIGSRRLQGSKITEKQPLHRRFVGKAFSIISKLLIISEINDTVCGFRLYKREAAMHVFPKQRIFGFAFDVEILYLAKKFGYKIKELPVLWESSAKYSKVNAFVHSFEMFFDLIRIRINDLTGKY